MAALKRKTRLRLKVFGTIFVLLLGVLIAAESRYAVFRINDIAVNSNRIVQDNALWGITSYQEEKFWPLYWISKSSHEKVIEAYFPVEISIKLVGWGKFQATCVPLSPRYKLYWGARYWYVASNGKVWLATLGENKYIPKNETENIPILSWSSDRTSPVDLSARNGNVMPSSLPIARITKWYENIEALGWLGKVKFVQAEMREGIPVVRLVFRRADGGSGTEVVFADDPADWYEAGLAVKKLYSSVGNIPQEMFIDTTYKGKILVKNKIQ